MKNSVIKADMLKKPSIINMIICAIRKSLGAEEKKKKVSYPKVIGPYKLVSSVKKTNNLNNYGIGIYKDMHGRKVFVKTWKGRKKNFPYYALINEYNMAKILSGKINSAKKGKFKVPNPIGYFNTKNSLSVVFEYINGKPLSKFSIGEQSRVINDAILFLGKLTPTLNKQDQKYIKKRGIFYYFFSLPAIFLYSFLLERESKKTIFYSLFRIYLHLISVLNKRLALVHGDLFPDNVFVANSHFYILDSEHMKYTLAEYDLNHLFIVKEGTKLLLHILKKRKNFTRHTFLCLYLGIQFSVFVEPKTKQRVYFDYLKN